jgi:D-alanyl-D-alanine carboxypeptidase (penicillin-binding protein 5/6)
MTRLLAALALGLLGALPALGQSFDTAARAAWVYDETTGTVLLEKNANEPLPPASMSKLMTVYMAFEALHNGTLSKDQTLPVSEHAMSYGGSTMFLNTLDRPTVWDLLHGIIVMSGNDATVVIAEALSPDGTEAGFAELMNQRAVEIGLTNSNFENSNGWPAEGHLMSVHDLGMLAKHLIEDFSDMPELYDLFAIQEWDYDGRAPANSQNRNPILGLVEGADGLKTGHTQEAGYGFVGSAEQDGRRIIFVVTGLPSMDARRTESERLANWAFRQFSVRDVGEAGAQLGEAEVWMGAQPRVGLVLPEDLSVLIPASGEVEASLAYQGPIAAPITAGQEVAELVLTREGMPEMRLPLVAAADVPRGGFVPRVQTAMGVLMAKAGLGAGATTEEAPTGSEEEAAAPASDGAATEGGEAETTVEGSAEEAAETPVEDGGEGGTEASEGEALQDGE